MVASILIFALHIPLGDLGELGGRTLRQVKTAGLIILGVLSPWISNAMGQTSGTAEPREAVLLEPVALSIQSSGGQKGSATFPKGRQVQVVETSGQRSKIAIPNFAEGWVENSSLEMLSPPASPSASDLPKDATAGATTTNNQRIPVAPKKTATPTVRTNVSIDEGEESKGICREKQFTHKIKVVLSGIRPEETQNYSTKAYALTDLKGGELRMIPLKELEKGSNSYNYYQRQYTCRCCKDLTVIFVGHAAVAHDKEGNIAASYATFMTKEQREFLEAQIGHSL
jgi:hypothetical protein